MSGTSGTSITPPIAPAPTPGSEIEAGIGEIETGVSGGIAEVETEVEAWRAHPDGPFAGIVAWAEAEFATLKARIEALEGGSVSAAPKTPASPPTPPAPSGAPAARG